MFYRPISDIHIEFHRHTERQFKGRISAPFILEELPTDSETVLGIAGDIDIKKKIDEFLISMSARFKAVVLTLGNHDYWCRSLDTCAFELKQRLQNAGVTNVHVLCRDSIEIEGVTFIGATLWTDFNNFNPLAMLGSLQMRDYKKIRTNAYSRRISPEYLASEHVRDRDFIFSFSQMEKPMVVISHHAPSLMSVDSSRYGINDMLNWSYASSLENQISYSNFMLWHHGHNHVNRDYSIHQTRVICNPYGYFGYQLNRGYDEKMLIDLKID